MIVGVDVSSRRIDLAWLDNGKPQRWHQELAKGHLIDRLRSIRVEWPSRTNIKTCRGTGMHDFELQEYDAFDVTDIAIEYPYAIQKPAVAALMATIGVITRQAPPWARVAWPSAGELRQAIGAKNTKTDAVRALSDIAAQDVAHWLHVLQWNEHELDALIACIGWTRILNQQDAA